jgi:sugar/nucleoside kinase (ribokinase family)
MSLLVVGSVAFDSIETPYGRAKEILGGSATFFSVAASWFDRVNLVAVVGEDFGKEHLDVFTRRSIDTAGLERASGKTFRWQGEYAGDMNEARTLDTQLNVFQHFAPKIPEKFLGSEYVFLGNIDPVLQLHVRRQLTGARLVACDSMNFWIKGKAEDLKKTLAVVDALVVNDGEARMLTGERNLKRAADSIRRLGPRMVVIKRGEHGATLFADNSTFTVPAYPLEVVRDPTGAGDTFAGGFLGHLARTGDLSEGNLRRALVYGSVMASFAVEEFGVDRMLRLGAAEIEERFREIKELTHFDV